MRKILTLISLSIFMISFGFAQNSKFLPVSETAEQGYKLNPRALEKTPLNANPGQRGLDTIGTPMLYDQRGCTQTLTGGQQASYVTYTTDYGYTFGTGANLIAAPNLDSIVNHEVGYSFTNCGITSVDGFAFRTFFYRGTGNGEIWGTLYNEDGSVLVDTTMHLTTGNMDTAGGWNWLNFATPQAVSGNFMLAVNVQPVGGADTFGILSTVFDCGTDTVEFRSKAQVRATSYNPTLGAMATPGSGALGFDSSWIAFTNTAYEVPFILSCDKTATSDLAVDDNRTLDAMGMANASLTVDVLTNDNLCDLTDFFWLSSPTKSWFVGSDFITVTAPTSGNASSVVLDDGQTLYSTLSTMNGSDTYTYTASNLVDGTNLTATVTINTTNAFNSIDEETLNNSVKFYPNPVVSEINFDIDFSEANDVTIEIFNVIGENIIAEDYSNVRNDKLSIDMSSYSEGAYFANITADGTTITKKFVVSK